LFPVIAVFFVQAGVAQQSFRSYQQLSGRALKNARQPDKKASTSQGSPMRFKGWNHPGKFRSDYMRRFSRPRARATRAELLKNATRGASHTSGAAPQFAPSALPGPLLRDSLPAGFIPTSVATGDFNGDGKPDFVVANGGDNNLWLYFGKGDGTFNLPIILPVTLGLAPTWVAAADLRGIGKTDLIVAEADRGLAHPCGATDEAAPSLIALFAKGWEAMPPRALVSHKKMSRIAGLETPIWS